LTKDFWKSTFWRRKFKNFRKKETKKTIFIYFLLCKQILSLFWRGFDLNDLDLTKIKSISDWFGFALFLFDLIWNFEIFYKMIWFGFGNCRNDLDLSNPTKFTKSNALPIFIKIGGFRTSKINIFFRITDRLLFF
jgi:hypothetical protein